MLFRINLYKTNVGDIIDKWQNTNKLDGWRPVQISCSKIGIASIVLLFCKLKKTTSAPDHKHKTFALDASIKCHHRFMM